MQKSIDYYNQAIKLDPNYAPAYAHMARAYFFLGFFSAIPPQQAWGKVKEAALLAIAKDDRLPQGHGALALAKLHYDWDFAGAEREFKRALELNPSNADIRHDYAHYLMVMGRMAESAAESKLAGESEQPAVHFSTIVITAGSDLPHSKQHAFNRDVINPQDGHILCDPYPAICGSLRIL